MPKTMKKDTGVLGTISRVKQQGKVRQATSVDVVAALKSETNADVEATFHRRKMLRHELEKLGLSTPALEQIATVINRHAVSGVVAIHEDDIIETITAILHPSAAADGHQKSINESAGKSFRKKCAQSWKFKHNAVGSMYKWLLDAGRKKEEIKAAVEAQVLAWKGGVK